MRMADCSCQDSQGRRILMSRPRYDEHDAQRQIVEALQLMAGIIGAKGPMQDFEQRSYRALCNPVEIVVVRGDHLPS